jgi:biotin synthase
MDVEALLSRVLKSRRDLSAAEAVSLLKCGDDGVWEKVFAAAREVKAACGKTETLKRALIECSNICSRDCFYCGIRRSNRNPRRYRMELDEVAECIERARALGYGAVALQAGEIESEDNTRFYEEALRLAAGMEVTLSLGEQEESVYRRWKDAGAMRYLLRIETSNRRLFAGLHPADASFDRRVGCIRTLKRLGYVTGTGVMISLPGQTAEDLAADIGFFGEVGADMVGMGPWIPHPSTPLAREGGCDGGDALELSLRMIALVRLHLHDVNIVASSALAALGGADAVERAVAAGANVVMPNFTPGAHRAGYDLYPGKTGVQPVG